MEEQVYKRQVNKLSISKRVVDKQQIERHFNEQDLFHLYNTSNLTPKTEPLKDMFPCDEVLASILDRHSELLYDYKDHELLLEDNKDDSLSKKEEKIAWSEYEYDKKKLTMKEKFMRYQKTLQISNFLNIYFIEYNFFMTVHNNFFFSTPSCAPN